MNFEVAISTYKRMWPGKMSKFCIVTCLEEQVMSVQALYLLGYPTLHSISMAHIMESRHFLFEGLTCVSSSHSLLSLCLGGSSLTW